MGEVFAGRYELVDPIGRGGVGAVWRAWDHRRRRYVAAKVLQQSDAHSLLRFVREQALRIDHPHVLAPASWAADDDKVLFTMDLVAGGSLAHLVRDYGPLPPSFVCTLLDQLLSGLAAVHGEGVVHRDIKPANVLLEATGTSRPRLRLSDFGIAMRLGEPRLTEADYVVGTPGYIAPEQLMGAEPDFPADLFAVGLVALYLLQGAKPDAKALIEYFTAGGTPGAPRGVPGPLWEVVATLLQPDPAARFRTATGARKALAAAAELLTEPSSAEAQVEILDRLGPLPAGFGPEGPPGAASGVTNGGSGPARLAPGSIPPRPTTAPTASGIFASAVSGTGTPASAASARGISAVAPRPPSPAVRPASAPPVVPPRPAVDPTPPPPPSTMSDTGSFHLPPPLPREAPPAVPHPPEQPPAPPTAVVTRTPAHRAPTHADAHADAHAHAHDHEATPVSPPGPPVRTPAATPVAPPPAVQQPSYPYAVQSPQAPTRPRKTRRHGRRSATRRPGPTAKVALPVLLLALVCYAVGFWALTRI